MCMLVILYVGGCYAWVARRHCLREAHRRPWVGVIGWHQVVVVIARSCGQVAHGCWFVVRAHSGDMSSAVWSSLARPEGTRVGVLTTDDSIDNNNK